METAEALQDQRSSLNLMRKAFKQQVRRAKLPFVAKLQWEFCAVVALLDDLEDNRGEASLMMVLQRKASMGHSVESSDFENGKHLIQSIVLKAHEQKLRWEKVLADAKLIMYWKANKFLREHSLAMQVRAMSLKGVAMTSKMLSASYVQSWGYGPHDERVTRHLNAISNVSKVKKWRRNFRRTFQFDYRKLRYRAAMNPDTRVTKVRHGQANNSLIG